MLHMSWVSILEVQRRQSIRPTLATVTVTATVCRRSGAQPASEQACGSQLVDNSHFNLEYLFLIQASLFRL